MGRHSLPDRPGRSSAGGSADPPPPGGPGPAGPLPWRRPSRRTVLVATAVVLALGAGTVGAARSGMLPFDEPCEGNTVGLRVAAEPSVAPALRAVADRAREDGTTSDGQCLDVRVSDRTGVEMAGTLGGGSASGFDVWVPDSALWVTRATAYGKAVPLDTTGSVASSPLGFAALPDEAEKLGWPERTYSWAELAGAAQEGALRVGSADPTRSASGLLALARIQQSTESGGKPAAAGKKDGKDEKGGKGGTAGKGDADVRAAAIVKLLSERTAPGDPQVLATLPRDATGAESGNPQRNQALLLSEQAAYTHNTGRQDAPDLRLFSPDDSTAFLDYPYTVLDPDSHDNTRTRAVTRFQTLLGSESGRRVLQRHGFREGHGQADDELSHTAGSRDPQPYGEPPADPPKSKDLSAVLGMWTITVQSVRLTTVVDASASMSSPVPGGGGESRMAVTKGSLLQALAQFSDSDEIGLWDFAVRLKGKRDYRKLVPAARLGERTDDGGTQRDRLTAAIGGLEPIPGGATGLYDTALAAYRDALDTYTKGGFNALVILTDGANEDPGSVTRGELVKELRKLAGPERPVPLIAIAVGPDADEEACREIAEATSGSSYRVDDPGQIREVILKAIMSAGHAG
ncbi:substrate-binding domain-containing protein [Streptomyces sp. Z26]|uniref:substrate-binding domain-containing protein n=1 Tax=Streptomyces sp. Z26 TaxID=2500177 RepID=UPI000EF159EC|nr:substrate-binding domain-containing protein [Streptomyces sp. Z26]RLL70006.1 VWA domain-containing protein [Streptomyces sp. Z26]